MKNDNRPNILLIVMDTARARTVLDNQAVMPNFHEFAREGMLFTNAFSTGPWTLPSHASLFTGQYTSDHGTHAGNKEFDPEVPTLAEELRNSGYQTIGFSNNIWISPEFGFDRGFDKLRTGMQLVDGGADLGSIAKGRDGLYEQARATLKTLFRRDGYRTIINGLYSKFLRRRYDSGAWLTNWQIKRWLSSKECQAKPFFMFVNYLEPHLKYDPPEDFKYRFIPDGLSQSDLDAVNQDAWKYICGQVEMDDQDFDALSALYKAELNYLDYRLGRLFDLLEEKGIMDETMVVIAGDHGENLGDHNLMDHQYCLYDTLLHVPLLVRYPDEFPAAERCEKHVELRDLYPTLLKTADVDRVEDSTVSSKPLQQTLTESGRKYTKAEYIKPQPSMNALKGRTGKLPEGVHRYNRRLRSIRRGRWKAIAGSDDSTRLYDLVEDPNEQSDVSEENETIVEELVLTLETSLDSHDIGKSVDNLEIDPTTQDRLEDLGYLQ
jgi:arylsulfatase A-like enzyme